MEILVTLETKVWEKDWRKVLQRERLCLTYDLNVGRVHRKLLINNVENPGVVRALANEFVTSGLIDEVVVVEDYLDEALRHFSLSKESLGKGLVYSSAEVVGILTCKTPFLCHYASDCWNLHLSNWCSRGVELLNSNPKVSVVNPIWNGDYLGVLAESSSRSENYAIGYGFSDQCYLVRADEFKAADLNLKHFASERYPAYGGELFEKRVDAWMRNNARLRATDLSAAYVHQR
jgi:hypothetical protein